MRRFAALVLLALIVAPALAGQEIKPLVRGSYQQIVAARQGKPFVVGFWSLTCHYCMAEMTMFKTLLTQYPGLDLVLIATDDDPSAVGAALNKYGLGKADAWIFADSYAERLRFEIDRTWQGELPRTYLYGAKGEVTAISGKLERAEIQQWIKANHAAR
jgi:thiol-disulfide isomerase/thioredoxin